MTSIRKVVVALAAAGTAAGAAAALGSAPASLAGTTKPAPTPQTSEHSTAGQVEPRSLADVAAEAARMQKTITALEAQLAGYPGGGASQSGGAVNAAAQDQSGGSQGSLEAEDARLSEEQQQLDSESAGLTEESNALQSQRQAIATEESKLQAEAQQLAAEEQQFETEQQAARSQSQTSTSTTPPAAPSSGGYDTGTDN